MSVPEGVAVEPATPMVTNDKGKSNKRKAVPSTSPNRISKCKQKMSYIRNNRGLFKDFHPVYDNPAQKEFPVLIQCAKNNSINRFKIDLLNVNKVLKNIKGVQYVKPIGMYFIKVFFSTMSDANLLLLNKELLEENEWSAKIPYDSIESQGVIRAPIEISEEDLLENLKASCEIIGVKRFMKKQVNGNIEPLQTVLLHFISTNNPDHVTYDHIWFTVNDYIKPLLQCFKCYKFGHGSGACKGKQTCSICAGPHFHKDCDQTNNIKCSNCTGSHLAISISCPIKSAKMAEIKQKVQGKFTYASAAGKKPINNAPTFCPSNYASSEPKNVPIQSKTPRGRVIVSDIINNDILLNAITKTIIELLKRKQSQDVTDPITTVAIKEMLISNFST